MALASSIVKIFSRRLVRGGAIAAVCVLGLCIFVRSVGEVYPVKDWLFWRLLVLWSWCALMNGGCLAFGHLIVTRWLGLRELRTLEKLVTSMAVGLVAFTMGMYLLGALALYRPLFTIALPVLMIVAGGPALLRLACQPRSGDEDQTRRSSFNLLSGAAVAAGILCLGLLYLQCMTPDALNYDSRWYHLTVAEDYAREGRIVPFLADYNRAFPQLASIVHTWSWTLPGLNIPLRAMMALHTEFCLFLWTLAGVAAVVAWLLERARVDGAWAAFFLFPVIFVYDSNIGGSADHVLGFFAAPLFLAALRAAEDLSPRRCALVGIVAAGAVLTKYQSLYFVVPIALLLGGRWLWLAVRRREARLWRGPVILSAVGALLVLPHFLKNWIFYRNPFFPFGVALFPGTRPRQPDTPFVFHYLFLGDTSIPRGSFLDNLLVAAKTTLTFSLRRPFAMGALFILLLPVIPFLRSPRRIGVGALYCLVAVMTWALTYPIERYAQAFVPLLAAVTAAMVIRAWEEGWIARAGLILLVGAQIVWGGDALFYSGYGRLTDAINMIRGGTEGNAKVRFSNYLRSQIALGQRLPKDAVVLFHNSRLSLGVNRKVLQDLPGFQGLISYRGVKTPRDICLLYRSFGITHVAHERNLWPAFTKQEEAIFAAFLGRYAINVFQEGEYEVFEIPPTLPPVEAPYRVLALGLAGYADGVYPVEAMNTYDPMTEAVKRWPAPSIAANMTSAAAPEIIDHVDVVMVPTGAVLPPPLAATLGSQFMMVISYGRNATFSVYVRRAPRAP